MKNIRVNEVLIPIYGTSERNQIPQASNNKMRFAIIDSKNCSDSAGIYDTIKKEKMFESSASCISEYERVHPSENL